MENLISNLIDNILDNINELKAELTAQNLYSPIIDKTENLINKRVKQLL